MFWVKTKLKHPNCLPSRLRQLVQTEMARVKNQLKKAIKAYKRTWKQRHDDRRSPVLHLLHLRDEQRLEGSFLLREARTTPESRMFIPIGSHMVVHENISELQLCSCRSTRSYDQARI